MFEESKKFNAYKELVLHELDEKIASGDPKMNWEYVTPAFFKTEALHILEERYDPKDEWLLRLFFTKKDSVTEYANTINVKGLNKFKPLVIFLRNRKVDTKRKNIELLAWLIDFQPRPFKTDRDYAGLRKERMKTDEPVTDEQTKTPDDPQIEPESGMPGNLFKWIAAAILLLALTVTGYHFLSQPAVTVDDTGGCMVWTGERYQQVACTYRSTEGLAVTLPLDRAKMKRFRKITKADTLTAEAIGKVWCVKIDGRYEYYTDSGSHPLYPEKHLRLLSFSIMNHNPVPGN